MCRGLGWINRCGHMRTPPPPTPSTPGIDPCDSCAAGLGVQFSWLFPLCILPSFARLPTDPPTLPSPTHPLQAMGDELQEQVPKIDALQQRTDAAGVSLKGVSRGAARLVGDAPRQRQRRGAAQAPSWAADQDASAAAVARAAVAAAPTVAKYGSMRLR